VKTTRRTTREETTRTVSSIVETAEEISFESSRHGSRFLEDPSASRATSWHHLELFSIEYPPSAGSGAAPQVKVFANGRQQVRVRVLLSPRNASGEYVAVPAAELLAALTLADYDTGHALPDGWAVEKTANEYSYDASVITNAYAKSEADYSPHENRALPNPAADDTVSLDLYVTAARVNSVRVAASIKPPEASQVVQTRPGASGDRFDTSVNIDARPPLNSPLEDFRTRESSRGNGADGWWAVTNHYISLMYQGFKKINLLRVEPDGSEERLNFYVDNDDSNGWEAVFTICQREYNADGWTFSSKFIPDMVRGESRDKVTLSVCASPPIENQVFGEILYVRHMTKLNMHFFWGQEDAGEVVTQRAYLIDEFGNSHHVLVGFKDRLEYPFFVGVVSKL
jgi:hypothetical protein